MTYLASGEEPRPGAGDAQRWTGRGARKVPDRDMGSGSAQQGDGSWPRLEAGGRQCHDAPSKRLVTEPSSKTSLIAARQRGAIESTVSLSNWRSGSIGHDDLTDLAVGQPLGGRAGQHAVGGGDQDVGRAGVEERLGRLHDGVSIMSSTNETRPSTSPTTRSRPPRWRSRVLWMKASGVPPSLSLHRSETRTRPESARRHRVAPAVLHVVDQQVEGEQVVDGAVKKPWMLAVRVDGHEPVSAGDLEHVGDEAGGDRLVLPGVGKNGATTVIPCRPRRA